MRILIKYVYGLIGDQCYKNKNRKIKFFEIIFSKYRYYSEYHKVAKFLGS